MPVSAVNPFAPVRSGKLVLYGPQAAIHDHDLDPSEMMKRHLFESAVIHWEVQTASLDPNCVCLLLTAQKGLVLEPVRKPGVARGIYRRAALLSFDGHDAHSWTVQALDWKLGDCDHCLPKGVLNPGFFSWETGLNGLVIGDII